jgi:hypothetical protein
MPSNSFPKCAAPSCQDFAISFSRHCWAHTPQTAYTARIKENLDSFREHPGPLNLKKVQCEGLDLSHLDLRGSSFSQAHLSKTTFIGANLSQCDMIGAEFSRCDFVGAQMLRVNATRAIFRDSSFSHATMRGSNFTEARFDRVDFMGALLFNGVLWNADLSGAEHLRKRNFINPKQRPGFARAAISEKSKWAAYESYRSLKHYFYRNGLYEDASWAAYEELTMQRRHFLRTRDPRYVPSLLMDLLSGYTEKPNRVILSSLGIIIFFGFLYYVLNAAWMPGVESTVRASFWDSLYFSFITFTTVGFGDLVPRPEVLYRLLVCAEAFSGPFMAGLYVFTLTRRYAVS